MKYNIGMKCFNCKKKKSINEFGINYDTQTNKIFCKECVKKYGFTNKQKEKKKYIRIGRDKLVKKRVKELLKRRSKSKSYPREFILKSKYMLGIARKNMGCSECFRLDLLQVHHIDKNIFNNENNNLVVLCYYCHSKRHKHMQNINPPKWLK